MATETENKTPQVIKKTSRKRKPAKAVVKTELPKKILLVKKHATTDNTYVGISRSVATSSILITALVLIFSPSNVWILGPVIGAMAIFGIALGYFSQK